MPCFLFILVFLGASGASKVGKQSCVKRSKRSAGGVQDGCPPRTWFGQQELRDTNLALAEAGLAVAKVVGPGTNEPLIKAKKSNSLDLVPEILSPGREGLRVMGTKVFAMVETEIGMFAEILSNGSKAGEKATWENVALNKVDRFPVVLEAVVWNRNGL